MIHCRVVTPEGLAKEMDTTILNVVSTVGQLGILSRHVPLVTPLAISRMITEESDGRKEYAVAGGLLYFENDLATILTNAIESKEEIDLRRAEEAKQRAEARLDDPNMDMRRAEVALKKAINRISVKNDLKYSKTTTI